MPFQKGTSGNPSGRPPGSMNPLVPRRIQLRVLSALEKRALDGDPQAAEVILAAASADSRITALERKVRRIEEVGI